MIENNKFSKVILLLKTVFNYVRYHKWIQYVVNGVLLLLIVLFVYNYLGKDWKVISQLTIRFNFKRIIYCLLLYGLNYVIFLVCWHLLIKQYNVNLSFQKNSYIYSYSQIGKLLPTPAWFISGRLVMYDKDGVSKRAIFLATMVEALLHFAVGGIIFLLLQIEVAKPITWLYIISIIPLILIVGYPNVLYSKLFGVEKGNVQPKTIGLIIVLFIITWILSAPYFRLLIESININSALPVVDMWKIWIISSLASYVAMFTLGGIGLLREFSLTFLLGPIVTPPIAVLIAALSRIVITIGNLVWPSFVILYVSLRGLLQRNSI